MIKLSVVVGTYNRLTQLKECIGSLIGKIKVNHEIIVIDAGSTDGTIDYLKDLSEKPENNLKLIFDEGRIGQAKSFNRVFKTLKSQYTCWLSDDNVVINNMLDKAVSILEQNNKIGMIALKVKDMQGEIKDLEYIGFFWKSGILNVNQGMIRTELLHKINYFDEEFADYGIDADLTTKVLISGFKVAYTKNIAIFHYRDRESGVMNEEARKLKMRKAKELYNQKYKILFDRKNKNSLSYIKSNNKIDKFFNYLYFFLYKYFKIFKQYNSRDIKNCIIGRFISYFDLIKNLNKEFYLVQSLPNKYIIKK